MQTSATARAEIRSLTAIRGFAAFWVVLFHFSPILFAVLPEASPIAPLIAAGPFAVPLFFILSGYVLALRYLDQFSPPTLRRALRFWWLRLGRIYPVHVLTLLVSLAMVARHGWPADAAHSRSSFAANLLMTHAWAHSYTVTWNYPSWSISSEWFAYLMFPILAWCAAGIGRRSARALVTVMAVLASAAYAFETDLPFRTLVVLGPTFIGGFALAISVPPGSVDVRRPWPATLALCIVALPFVVAAGAVQSAIYLAVFFVLVGVLAAAGERAGAFWQSRLAVYLGDISYSLYMAHVIVITLLARFVAFDSARSASLAVRLGVSVGCLLVIVGAAALMYHAFERPLRELSRRAVAGPAAARRLFARLSLR